MGLTAGDLHLLAESIDVLNEKMDELLAGRDERGIAINPADRDSYGPVYVPVEMYVAAVDDVLNGDDFESIRLVWSGDPELGFELATVTDES